MCTYSLTLNDTLVKNARRSFQSQDAITMWMQQQLERLLLQVAIPAKGTATLREVDLTSRIKALSAVPLCTTDTDYKEDITNVMNEKYQG